MTKKCGEMPSLRFIAGILGLAPLAHAGTCFQDHLYDAIAQNHKRAPIYASLTHGDSALLSSAMISSERAALVTAFEVDAAAAKFEEAGVFVVCDAFVSMRKTPELLAQGPEPFPKLKAFRPLKLEAPTRIWRRQIQAKRFDQLANSLRTTIAALEREPRFNCMTRHTLESMLRIATQVPLQEGKAKNLGMSSPAPISARMLSLHLEALKIAHNLDRMAAPIQAKGLPIVCQDVPPISSETDLGP